MKCKIHHMLKLVHIFLIWKSLNSIWGPLRFWGPGPELRMPCRKSDTGSSLLLHNAFSSNFDSCNCPEKIKTIIISKTVITLFVFLWLLNASIISNILCYWLYLHRIISIYGRRTGILKLGTLQNLWWNNFKRFEKFY